MYEFCNPGVSLTTDEGTEGLRGGGSGPESPARRQAKAAVLSSPRNPSAYLARGVFKVALPCRLVTT